MITSDDHYYRRKLPSAMSGLFYSCDLRKGDSLEYVSTSRHEEASKDAASLLSFLPHPQTTQLLRSCNGMILCKETNDNYLFVCNPVTKRWAKVPKPADYFHILALVFDPRLSPHYKVVAIFVGDEEEIDMEIFSSETGQWVESRGCEGIDIYFDLEHDFPVFSHGNIHLLHCRELAVVAIDTERKACRTMRLPLAPQHVVARLLVEFAGSLRCAVQTSHEMLVWDLADYDQNEWILKYSISLCDILEKQLVSQSPFDGPIVALHPDMDVVFLDVGGVGLDV